ncbi:Bug family tripartite tricarboxylate transporter substrate binding protein [Achromobacter denitrificans]
MNRATAVSAFLFVFSLAGTPSVASENYPTRPIRLVVPAPPGSGTDAAARILAQPMQAELGGSIVIENRPGAAGQVGSAAVARSAPDGYTLLLTSNTSHSAAPFLYKQVAYDPVKDFTAIGRISFYLFALLVPAGNPAQSPSELAAYAKKKGAVSYSFGNSTAQVAGAVFVKSAGIDATPVAYKGTPPALADVAGGVVDFMFADWAAAQPFVSSGRLRAIGTLSSTPSNLIGDVTPMAGDSTLYSFSSWAGIAGPAGMDKAIVSRLNKALNVALNDKEVQQKLGALGMVVAPDSSENFDAFVSDQVQAWGDKITSLGISVD